MAIVLRSVKGSALTHAEMDQNFIDLRDGVDLMVPRTQGKGLRTDSQGTPSYGWHDLLGTVFVPDPQAINAPSYELYVGTLYQYQFAVNDEGQFVFHLPHDYVVGTDIYIHAHWSHNSTDVTGGQVTWGFQVTYAKGHDQASFSIPVSIVEVQEVSTTRYQHMVCEGPASIVGGSATLLNTNLLEPDGLIFGKVYLAANTMTVSQGGIPDPFLHTVDIHYQSAVIGTKSRSPDFWN